MKKFGSCTGPEIEGYIYIVNWTLSNKLWWNCNRNSNIFIQANAFKSFVCGMAAILYHPQCAKTMVCLITCILHFTQKIYVSTISLFGSHALRHQICTTMKNVRRKTFHSYFNTTKAALSPGITCLYSHWCLNIKHRTYPSKTDIIKS